MKKIMSSSDRPEAIKWPTLVKAFNRKKINLKPCLCYRTTQENAGPSPKAF